MFKLIVLVILSSCSLLPKTKVNIHPATVKYVNKFNNLLKQSSLKGSITNLEVHLSKTLPYSTLAVCVRESLKTPVVYVNQLYWTDPTYLTDLDREEIIFHELGHCVLNRPHAEHKESLMYPYHLGPARVKLNYTKYINELFKASFTEVTGLEASSLKPDSYQATTEEPSWAREELREEIMIKDIEEIAAEHP